MPELNQPFTGKMIDLKFGIQDNQIVKVFEGRIVEILPDDEPKFLFRARDMNALPTLSDYCAHCVRNDPSNEYQLTGIVIAMDQFRDFRIAHPERMKLPGITKGH